jgi:lincosamide nucleotidyltransferase A/C/D/E
MMTAENVIEILKMAERINIALWIDGGWGIDALVKQQTRQHNDVDIVIEQKNAKEFIKELTLNGYSEEKTEYTTASHSVWKTADNRIVDLHLIEFDETGIAHYEGATYPEGSLNSMGEIGNVLVRCVSAEAQLLFHQGYKYGDSDIHDVQLLCKTFGLALPYDYKFLSLRLKNNSCEDDEKY